MTPFEHIQFLKHVHRNVDIEQAQDILFAGTKIVQSEFLPLYHSCMELTGTPAKDWKIFRRAQRTLYHSLSVKGARIECGVFKGFSSLMLSRIAKMRDESFDGTDFYLVDSFEGLSAPTKGDSMGTQRISADVEQHIYSHKAGHFSTTLGYVQSVMVDFPGASIQKGSIPEIFSELPETGWSFVHIDVDLYEPTKAYLNYFLDRMAPGGVIVNDDFGSPLFPGGGRGWQEVMESKSLSYTVLDTGQAVYVK